MKTSLFAVVIALWALCILPYGSVLAQPVPVASAAFADRPNSPEAQRLAPISPPPFPTPAGKLPLDKLAAPTGFRIELFMAGVTNAREMAVSDKGIVYVGSRLVGKVHAIVMRNGKRELKVVASGLHRPNGVAVHKGSRYIAEISRISRIDNIDEVLDHPPEPTLVYDDLPKDEAHGWKFIAIGPDEKLYVPIGQPCNNCVPAPTHGQIRRMNLDGSGVEVVARGVRNSVGFDWRPGSNELYFTDNGRDWLSEDVPEDELNRVTRTGEHFGAPYCYQGNIADSEFGWGRSCSEFTPPVALMGPHSASLGMRFYTGSQFPAEFRGAIFVARHGSWNRSRKFGGDIAVVKLNADGSVKSIAPFITGFIQDNEYVGRPDDVVFLSDGSMLISDDFNGAIYRVSYVGPLGASK